METIRIVLTLTKAEAQALIGLAAIECRHPREQARFVIRQGLIMRGALPEDAHNTRPIITAKS